MGFDNYITLLVLTTVIVFLYDLTLYLFDSRYC